MSYDGNEFISLPTCTARVVGLYEAGSVHLTAFSSGLLRAKSNPECVSMAGAAASIKVEQTGVMFSLDEKDLLQRTESLMGAAEIN